MGFKARLNYRIMAIILLMFTMRILGQNVLPSPYLISPANGITMDSAVWNFVWVPRIGIIMYQVEISLDTNFSFGKTQSFYDTIPNCIGLLDSTNSLFVMTTVKTQDTVVLPPNTYYWHVCDVIIMDPTLIMTSGWSPTWSFTINKKPTTQIIQRSSKFFIPVPISPCIPHFDLLGRGSTISKVSRIIVGKNTSSVEIH
ncbi:MAG TPA: hypothetical protein VLX68_03230 [Chitinivibrionales bacterium]|nr:hypothetical protein [Chitinivibrionales bacterium]